MAKPKKNKNKAKLNLTVRDEQRNKLEQMASLENRSLSNLIEVMADERWERLAEQQGVAYAKTVAEAMNLKLDMDNPADREKMRRALSILSPRETASSHSKIYTDDFFLPRTICVHLGKSGARNLFGPAGFEPTTS